MTKRIGFACVGPIDSVHRTAHGTDDWEQVTDRPTLEKLFRNCMAPEDFCEYSDEYSYIWGGNARFLFIDDVPSIQVTYYFRTDEHKFDIENDVIEHEDGTVRALEYLVDAVVNETRGQLSDGIGEGFEQNPCFEDDTHMYFISPGYPDMTVKMFEREV